jgi:hypothetical protein
MFLVPALLAVIVAMIFKYVPEMNFFGWIVLVMLVVATLQDLADWRVKRDAWWDLRRK